MTAIEHTFLLDIPAVADRLGVNVRWVRRQVASRRIPFYKLAGVLRFDVDEIDAWLEASRVPTTAEALDAEQCTWAERQAGGRRVAGPPMRPVTSIRRTQRSGHPAAGREPDGFDPPSAS